MPSNLPLSWRSKSMVIPKLLLVCLTILSVMKTSQQAYSLRNINILNLLLPYSKEVQMEYVIESFNGCYQWSSNFSDTLSVGSLPEHLKSKYINRKTNQDYNEKCENAVLVSVGKRNEYDGIIWLKAIDIETKEFLKCEAKVKKIKRLEILTKFRTLDIGDHEQVELIGYDEENNSFTTLEGLKFEWSVKGIGEADFVSFRKSNFKTTTKRHKLENMNYQSDIVILKGIRTGKVTLKVKLLDRSYSETITTAVDIHVIEHFEIQPERDLFMLPCSMKQLEMFTVRTKLGQLVRTKVSLPSEEFIWETDDSGLSHLHSDGILKTGKELGQSSYIVKDKSKEDNKIQRDVHIVIPRNINLYVKELSELEATQGNINSEEEDLEKYENNWNLLKGRYYRVLAGFFDENDNRISLGTQEVVTFDYDPSKFEIIDKEKDYIVLTPLVTTKFEEVFSAELNFHDPNCLPKQYKILKQYTVLSEITLIQISLRQILLPGNSQRMKLFAVGGSENYEWITSDKTIIQVEQNGTLISGESGLVTITVRDRNNLKNRANVSVQVVEASRLNLIERKIEMLKGGARELMFSARDNQNNSFTYCTGLAFNFDSQDKGGLNIDVLDYQSHSLEEGLEKVDLIHNYVKSVNLATAKTFEDEYAEVFQIGKYKQYIKNKESSTDQLEKIFKYYKTYGICSGFRFSSDTVGEYFLKHALIKRQGTIRVYENYQFVYPENYHKKLHSQRPIILYNSYGEFSFANGPWLWKDSKSGSEDFSYKIMFKSPLDKNHLEIVKIYMEKNLTKIKVRCLSPKNSFANKDIDVVVKGSNRANEDLLNPVIAEGVLRVSCKIPTSIRLFNIKEQEVNYSHLERKKKKLGLNLGGKYKFMVELFDEQEHLFWAKESGVYDWTVDNSKLGFFEDSYKNLDFNTLQINKKKTGTGYAKVRIDSLKKEISKDGTFLDSVKINKLIEDKVLIEGLDQLTLSSEHILIFYHPDVRYQLSVGNGSGKFKITSDDKFIKTKYLPKKKKIIITPLKLGKTLLEVEDLDAEAKMKAIATIEIVEMKNIKAEIEHKILEENQTSLLYVKVFDHQNRLIPREQYEYMDLQLSVLDQKSHQIDIKRVKQNKLHEMFLVKPSKADNYSFEIIGKDSEGFTKRSNKIGLNVFKKMKVFPENIYLAKGCITAFEIRGGPDKFTRKNNNIVLRIGKLKNIGQLIQRENSKFEFRAEEEGTEKISIRLINKKNSTQIGEVVLTIQVLQPTGFDLIGISSGKLLTTATARIIVIPKSNNILFTPALCPIEYEWTNLNREILELEQSAAEEACGEIPKDQEGNLDNEKLEQLISSGWQALGKNVKGLNQGFAELEIVAKMRGRVSKKNMKIEVIDGLGIVRDKYIKVKGCEEGILLLPPKSLFQIHLIGIPLSSNTDFYFSILQKEDEKLVMSNPIGKLKTSNKEGYALLKISQKTNPNNEVLVPIVIKFPSSLIIEDSGKVTLVPVKSSMTLKVRLIDSMGRVFAHPLLDYPLSVLSSDSSILETYYYKDKGQIQIYANREGETTIVAADPLNPGQLFDILAIKIGSLITPSSPVNIHIGGQVRFKINNKILLNKSKWKSSNNEIVKIENGIVKAVSSGKAVLRFDETVNLSSIITVFEIDQIVEEKVSKVLTNIPSHKEFKTKYGFTFKLYSNGREINLLETEKFSPEIDNSLQWGCYVDSTSLTSSKHRFMRLDNKDYLGCILEFSDWTQVSEDWSFKETANIIFYLENKEVDFKIQQKIPLKIIHGFFIENNLLIDNRIKMDNNTRTKEILIKTKEQLQIHFSNNDFKKHISISFLPNEFLMKLIISLPEDYSESFLETKLDLSSRSSGQTASLTLVYDPSNTILKRLKQITNIWPSFFGFLSFSDILIILVAVTALYIIWKYLKGKEDDNEDKPFVPRNYASNYR